MIDGWARGLGFWVLGRSTLPRGCCTESVWFDFFQLIHFFVQREVRWSQDSDVMFVHSPGISGRVAGESAQIGHRRSGCELGRGP